MRVDKEKFKVLERHVNSYKNGQLIVKSGFKPIDISSGIDWGYSHSTNKNTYQTYIHSLNFINVLTEFALYKNERSLMKDVHDIIMDWYKKNQKKRPLEENFAWSEHPAASRIMNIISFQENTLHYRLKDKVFKNLIQSHCEFLNDEKNYKMNNHGLMMDNALLRASDFIEDNKMRKIYEEKAIYRIKLSLYRDFSRRGVHLENSPEYHRMVLIIYRNIMRTLKDKKIKLDTHFKNLYNAAESFKSFMIKPNLEYPMLGDTGQIVEKSITKQFVDFIDYDAGFAILQRRNNDDTKKSTYLTFRSGYQSKTHKHLDDLSITYYLNGHDLLIDPGKYSYDKNDKIRQYLISPEAHTTVGINNKQYILRNPYIDIDKLKIVKYYSTDKYRIISGINKLYNNSSLNRTIIITNDPALIIIDRVINKNVETVSQYFNINPEAKITKISNLFYKVELKDYLYNIETLKVNNKEILSDIKHGYVSYKFSKSVSNKRIVFEQKNKSTTFITTVLEDNLSINNLKYENKVLTFNCNGEEYTIDL